MAPVTEKSGKRGTSATWSNWVGVMSGTSLDGVDAVLASFRGEGKDFEWKLVGHHSLPFVAALQGRLFAVAEGEPVTSSEFARLHFAVGEVYAAVILELLADCDVSPEKLEGVGISGQTVFHLSAAESRSGGITLQLGSAAIVAERVGVPVVSDFRSADVAAGGEGAPLVPYADYLLLHDDKQGRVVLNIGGIANFTAMPAGGSAEDVVALDTGPGNMIMDGIVRLVSQGKEERDTDGARAQRGKPDAKLVESVLSDPFFSKPPPRSTGREQFGIHFVHAWMDEGRTRGLSEDDLVASACALTAESVARAIREFVLKKFPVNVLYVAGGGAHNPALLQALADRLEGLEVETSWALGLPPECRESLAFAVLARETWFGRPSNLPQVTGAGRRVVLGQITGVKEQVSR